MNSNEQSNTDQLDRSALVREIYERDARDLSPAAAQFAEQHPVGRRERRIAGSIAEGVAELPRMSVPARLRAMVLDRLRKPAYRWYHLAATAGLAAISPIAWQHSGALSVAPGMLPWVFLAFGLLNLVLVVPLAAHIYMNRRGELEELGRSFDDYLEHPSRIFTRFRS